MTPVGCSYPSRCSVDVRCFAPTAPAEKLNALRFRLLGKAFERTSRQLDGLHFVGELRQLREAGSFLRGPECRWLRGDRNGDRLAHLARDCQNAIGLLLTIHTHGAS